MTLNIFLLITLMFLLAQMKYKRISFGLFLLYGLVCFFYLKSNFNPNIETAANADKHVIAVTGYKFNNSLVLYNDSLAISDVNDHSIFGSNNGGFEIINDSNRRFVLSNLDKPFFIEDEKSKKLVLQNPIGEPIKQSVTIKFIDNSEFTLLFNEKEYPYYIANIKDQNLNESIDLDYINSQKRYNSNRIKYGYPLKDFVTDNIILKDKKGVSINTFQKIKEKLELVNSVYLVREKYEEEDSDLRLVGRIDNDLVASISINGNQVQGFTNDFSYPISKDTVTFSLSFNKSKPEKYTLISNLEGKDKGFIKLESRFIHWFPLFSDNSNQDVSLFFTSNPASVVKTVFNKGIHIRGNNNFENKSGFDASLNYKPSKLKNSLEIEILDHNVPEGASKPNLFKVKSGEAFELNTRSNGLNANNEVYRLFKLIDLEEKSVFNPKTIFTSFFIFFGVLLFLVAPLQKIFQSSIGIEKYFVPAATVILAFVTFKFFLFWRTSVFIPIADISDSLYQNLNNPTYLWRNTLVPFAMFAIAGVLAKFGVYHRISDTNKEKASRIRNLFFLYILLFVFAALGMINIDEKFQRLIAIFFPLCLYFLSYYLIVNGIAKANLCRNVIIFNILLFSAFFFLTDAGFAIIFIIFVLLKQILLKLNSVVSDQMSVKYKLLNGELISYVVMLVLVLLGTTSFVSGVFANFQLVIIVACVLITLFASFILFKHKNQFEEFCQFYQQILPIVNKKTPVRMNKSRFAILMIVLIASGYGIYSSKSLDDSLSEKFVHIKYRAQTLTKEIKDIIQEEEFGSYNSKKIVETATNKWFLSYFLDKGSKIAFIDTDKNYHLQKHFKHGVSYPTQSTDVMVSRFIIGEHGRWAPVLFGLLLLAILIYYMLQTPKTTSNNRMSNASLVAVFGIGMLLTLAFFVYMTVTNSFIFFGQDFPFLSVQSLLSPLTFFTVFGALFLFLRPSDLKITNKPTNNTKTKSSGKLTFGGQASASTSLNTNSLIPNHPYKFLNYPLIIFIPFVFIVIPYFRYQNNYQDTFKLGEVFTDIKEDFEMLNARLKAEQESIKTNTSRENQTLDMTSFAALFEYIDFEKDISNLPYAKTLFDNLRKQIEAHKNLSLLQINESGKLGPLVLIVKNNIIEVKLENNFYDLPSPDAFEKVWKGSLVAKKINNASSITDISDLNRKFIVSSRNNNKDIQIGARGRTENVEVSVIPADWFYKEMHDVVLVDLSSGSYEENTATFKILRANEQFQPKNLTTFATRLLDEDILSIEKGILRNQYFYSADNLDYFAKNIWINGDYRHYYPFEDKFILAYNMVEYLKSDVTLHSKKEYDKGIDYSKEDIALTIDYPLHSKLQNLLDANLEDARRDLVRSGSYNKVEKDKMNASVVVLSGDGDILAMNDSKFKDKDLIFNPNDPKSMYRTRLKLMSHYNNLNEEKAFGNYNLIRMQNGPHSTIKPIMFTAITSGFNLNWNELEYLPPTDTTKFIKQEDNYVFLDHSVSMNAANPKDGCDIVKFIPKSRNTYNLLLTILGSYTEEELNNLGKIMIRQTSENETFPRFIYRGNTYVFNYETFKEKDGKYSFKENGSIIHNQLLKNFGLKTTLEDEECRNYMPFNRGTSAKAWIQSMSSHLLTSNRNNTQRGISQIVAGSDPLIVTPLKMAEMYGKLFSGNRNFRPSLGNFANSDIQLKDSCSFTEQPFYFHEASWGNESNWNSFVKRYIIGGMKRATEYSEGIDGTARTILESVKKEFNDFEFYAKTGTGSTDDKHIQQNKHLAVIITKRGFIDNYGNQGIEKSQKYIVVYFALHGMPRTSDAITHYPESKTTILREILNAESVKAYFSDNN